MVLVELIYYIGVRYIITDDDTLSSYEDVTEFYNTIEDKSNVELLDLTKYGHVDVLSADSAYEDIFIPILNFLNY